MYHSSGGANGYGTVFSLSVGLGPFVETRPTSGEATESVEILGTDLTGATSVSFTGTAAVFEVVSSPDCDQSARWKSIPTFSCSRSTGP